MKTVEQYIVVAKYMQIYEQTPSGHLLYFCDSFSHIPSFLFAIFFSF